MCICGDGCGRGSLPPPRLRICFAKSARATSRLIFPSTLHILVDPDGRFFVEPAVGPPAPIRNYRCRERSRAERIAYLHERDRRLAPGGAGINEEPEPMTAAGEEPRETQSVEQSPIVVPVASTDSRRARRLRELMAALKTSGEVQAVAWQAPRLHAESKVDDDKAECMKLFDISERGYEERVWPAARMTANLPEKGEPGPKKSRKK